MNKVILAGRLGHDPEIKNTKDGQLVTTVNIATTEISKENEYTEWHRIVAFGRTAEIMGKYLKKGVKILVEGKLRTNRWSDNEGITRSQTTIVVDRMEFMESKKEDNNKDNDSNSGDTNYEEDVPF